MPCAGKVADKQTAQAGEAHSKRERQVPVSPVQIDFINRLQTYTPPENSLPS